MTTPQTDLTKEQRAEWQEHQERLYAMAVDDGDTWDLSENDQAACNAGGDAIMALLARADEPVAALSSAPPDLERSKAVEKRLRDIAQTIVMICESGGTNLAHLACTETSPLVGECRSILAVLAGAESRNADEAAIAPAPPVAERGPIVTYRSGERRQCDRPSDHFMCPCDASEMKTCKHAKVLPASPVVAPAPVESPLAHAAVEAVAKAHGWRDDQVLAEWLHLRLSPRETAPGGGR